PLTGRLAGAGVVVVERLGHTRQLVRLLAHPELRDAQHAGHETSPRSPTRSRDCAHHLWCLSVSANSSGGRLLPRGPASRGPSGTTWPSWGRLARTAGGPVESGARACGR